jgi:ligand-binding sensor domain-containing protein
MKLFLPKLLVVLFFVTCFSLPESSFAQQPLTRKISFLEGLPTDVIYDLFVDKGGLLYLGTDKGLITFNGVHFEQIKIPDALGNTITSIQQDEKGVIWCKNFANQLFFLVGNDLVADQKVKALLENTDMNLVDYAIGTNAIYLLTQKVLYKYAAGKMSRVFDVNKREAENLNSIIYHSGSAKLYVSSTHSLFIFKNEVMLAKQDSFTGPKVLEIFKDELAYCSKALDEICVVDNKIITLQESITDHAFLNRLSATKNLLWLCTNNGIYEYDEKNFSFKDGFLKDMRIMDIVLDLEGNHWIATLDDGLYMLPNRNIYELTIPFNKKSIYTRISKGPNGNYFVGTNDGKIIEFTDTGISIRAYKTRWDNSVEFINFAGDTLMTNYGFFKIGNSKIISKEVYFGKYLKEDESGNLLIASTTFGGLMKKNFKGKPNFVNKNNKFNKLRYGENEIETLVFRNKRTKSVLFHPLEQKYYYGFIDGLFVYDLQGNEQEIRGKDGTPIIAADMIMNADGSIWIASAQKGVFLIKNKKIIKHFTERNGLSDNNCLRIAKDVFGLWIITENGFDYYDSNTNRIKDAELNLCIKGIKINDIAVLDQTIALATNKGIYYFDKSVLNPIVLPKFKIVGFLVNNRTVALTKNLSLAHNQNNINIKFRTVHYKSLGNYNYRYRLKGLDNKWFTSASSSKSINFLALKPGTYKFQMNIKIGEKYTAIQEIDFEIAQPWWLQLWFLTIAILALIALMYAVYRWTELKTRKSEELKEQLALSQLTALRSQMNPHFIFNVLNAVQGLIYSNQKSKASDYLGKFSDLMRRILDSSDKNEVTIEKEFETIDLYISLEKARFDSDFEYKITFPDKEDLSSYSIPSMIIQPFVENAIKHGLMHKQGLKKLDIKVELLEDVWCFTIDDNGIGRKASEIINQKIKQHISFATKAIENRIKLISKTTEITIDIEVIDKKAANDESLGTRIKIYIPIGGK